MNSRLKQPQREKEFSPKSRSVSCRSWSASQGSFPRSLKDLSSVWFVEKKQRRPPEDAMEWGHALKVPHTMQNIEGHLGQSRTFASTTLDTDTYDTPYIGSDDSSAEFDDDTKGNVDDELLSDGSDFSDGVRIYDDPYDEGETGNVDDQIYEIDIFEASGARGGVSIGATHRTTTGSSQGAWSSTPPPKLKVFSVTENIAPGGYANVEANPPPIPGRPLQVTGSDRNQTKGEAYKGKVALQPPRKQHMRRTDNDFSAEQSKANPNDPGIDPSSILPPSPRSPPSAPLADELASSILKRAKALHPPAGHRKEPPLAQGFDTVCNNGQGDTSMVLSTRHMCSAQSTPDEFRHNFRNPTANSAPIADELAMKLSNRIRAMNKGNGTESRHHVSHSSSSSDQTNILTRATNLGISDEIGGRQLYHNVDIQHVFQKDQKGECCSTSPSHKRVDKKFDPSKSALQPTHGRRMIGTSNEEHGAFNISLRDTQVNALPIPKVLQKKKALTPPHLSTKDAISFDPRSPVMSEWKTTKQPKSPAPKPAPKPSVLFDENYENTEIGQPDVRAMANGTKLGSAAGVEQDISIPRTFMQNMTGTVVFSDEAEAVLVGRTDLQDYLHVGDQVLQIAGIDVRNSCAAFVTECWKRTYENPVRVKVLRR